MEFFKTENNDSINSISLFNHLFRSFIFCLKLNLMSLKNFNYFLLTQLNQI